MAKSGNGAARSTIDGRRLTGEGTPQKQALRRRADNKGRTIFVMDIIRFQVGSLKIEIYPDGKAVGAAAAEAAVKRLNDLDELDRICVVFATGASQMETLASLVATRGIPWEKIVGFHMDEYVGIDESHPASFRRYLREKLTTRVSMREFSMIDGNACDLDDFCRKYGKKLHEARPQLCLLGVGENGHLAFNDPGEADFRDPQAMKVVSLDSTCRQQQVAEGWFSALAEVPEQALTLTIPTLLAIPRLIISVPGKRKAQIIKRTLCDEISRACPATIFRTHPDATLFLDSESAAELDLKNSAALVAG